MIHKLHPSVTVFAVFEQLTITIDIMSGVVLLILLPKYTLLSFVLKLPICGKRCSPVILDVVSVNTIMLEVIVRIRAVHCFIFHH